MDMPTFDELRDIAQRDPAGFELLRSDLIEDCIRHSSVNSQHRLRGLKFVIDARRGLAGSPMKALLDMQGMMYESCLAMQQILMSQQPSIQPSSLKNTMVLPFRRSSSSPD